MTVSLVKGIKNFFFEDANPTRPVRMPDFRVRVNCSFRSGNPARLARLQAGFFLISEEIPAL